MNHKPGSVDYLPVSAIVRFTRIITELYDRLKISTKGIYSTSIA